MPKGIMAGISVCFVTHGRKETERPREWDMAGAAAAARKKNDFSLVPFQLADLVGRGVDDIRLLLVSTTTSHALSPYY